MLKIVRFYLFLLFCTCAVHSQYITETLVSGIYRPSVFEFIPNSGNVFINLKESSTRIYNTLNNTQVSVFWNFQDSMNADGERGVMGICTDPDFIVNHYVYIFYSHGYPTPRGSRVVRLTENNNVGTNPLIIYQYLPGLYRNLHVGGNLRFGNDGKLYITVGNNGNNGSSQMLTNPEGKILRINSDGTIPADNPFYDDGDPATGNDDRIWAYGLRNSFDFYINQNNNFIYATENGNNGFDEVNFIQRGKNYGWVICEGYCDPYNPLYKQPMNVWPAPLPAVTGVTLYQGTQIPWLTGKLLVADNNYGRIYECTLNNTSDSVVSRNIIIDTDPLTTLKVGPDGYLYALNGGYVSNGKLLRIKPDPTGVNVNNEPVKFSLSQNYPNPFNPVTSIKYEIPKEGFVTLKIFNTLGMELTTLVNETKQQGSYEVTWDASNYPSGVYFYELTTGDPSTPLVVKERKKMVLIK